jgi:hypothetical protein
LALQAKRGPVDVQLHLELAEAIARDETITADQRDRAAAIVRRADGLAAGEDMDATSLRLMQVQAALLIARFADDEMWIELGGATEALLRQALEALDDPEHREQGSLQFDPAAMGFVGLVYARLRPGGGEVRSLLAAATAASGGAVRGASHVAEFLDKARPGLARALVRLGLGRAVWETRLVERSDAAKIEWRDRLRAAAKTRVEAELAWLDGGAEPPWPVFPGRAAAVAEAKALGAKTRAERGIEDEFDDWRDPVEPVPAGVDKEGAGAWIQVAMEAGPVDAWRLDLMASYSDWTLRELDAGGPRRNAATSRWMHVYFGALGGTAAAMSSEQRKTLVLEPLAALDAQSILITSAPFLRALDEIYFNSDDGDAAVVIALRQATYAAVRATPAWDRMARVWSDGVERHLAEAVAGLLFNAKPFGEPSRSYLLGPAVERLDPFLPLIVEIASAGASPVVAQAVLNVLEIAPRAGFARSLLAVAEAWMTAFPGHAGFWSEFGVGKQVTRLLDSLSTLEPSVFEEERGRLETLLAKLVAVGVAEAARLEARLFQQTLHP